LTLYFTIVLNKITYASQSFSGYLLEQHIDRLQAILNKAKKMGTCLFSITYVISSKTKIIDFSGKYQVSLNTPAKPFSHQLEALPWAPVTAVILTRCLAVSITYIKRQYRIMLNTGVQFSVRFWMQAKRSIVYIIASYSDY